MFSSLVPIIKGKGDPLNSNSYRGIKLLEHAFELYKKVLDGHWREVVDINRMQYGFMPGRGPVDAVFALRGLVKNSEPKMRNCFLYLLTWKRLLIGCQGKLFVLL